MIAYTAFLQTKKSPRSGNDLGGYFRQQESRNSRHSVLPISRISNCNSQGKNLPPRIRRFLAGVVLCLPIGLTATAVSAASMPFDTCELVIAGHTISNVPIARTRPQMELGLSDDNQGDLMIFQWPDIDKRVFWMRGTSRFLSAIPLSATHQAVEILPMEPNTDSFHWTTDRVQTVIEIRSELVETLKVKPGTQIVIGACATPT